MRAGAPGFRDFPGLLMTKENRNGSHQTLPHFRGISGCSRQGFGPNLHVILRWLIAPRILSPTCSFHSACQSRDPAS